MISAANTWIVSIDNASVLRRNESDMLCRLATGAGYATRELYTNRGEMVFDASRPIILNSIGTVVSRSDLADRAVILRLPPMPDALRRTEQAFWSGFDTEAPGILGALLDTVARALVLTPRVHLTEIPRMADFARFGVAVGMALGWPDDAFINAYQANRRDSSRFVVEGDAVARAIRDLLGKQTDDGTDEWKSTATELLTYLRSVILNWDKDKSFPKDASHLSSHLMQIAPALRAEGIDVVRSGRSRLARMITIRRIAPSTVTAVTVVTNARGDDTDDGGDAASDASKPAAKRKVRLLRRRS
jgi:hypothetical protein